MRALGVDPGLSGGLALVVGEALFTARLVDVIDIPVIGSLKSKRRVDVHRVLDFINSMKPDVAFIERAKSMPDQSSSAGFNYGVSVGYLEACCIGMRIPIELVEAPVWKRFHGLSGRFPDGTKRTQSQVKELSRQRAIALFPDTAHKMKLHAHHNRAEAALIAVYGIVKHAQQRMVV